MRSRTLLAPLLCALAAYGADPALQAVYQRMDKAAANFKGCTADVVKIQLVEFQAAGFELLVVAGDTVLIKYALLGVRCQGH